MSQDVEIKEEVDDEFGYHGDVELLQYEEQMMLETMAQDVLVITARGLGLERLFLNHLILYSHPKLLFLVLNTTQYDEAYFIEKLKEMNLPTNPKVLNSDVSTKDRQSIYKEGGVQFITSRILLVDFLTGNVPVDQIDGILVYRAHQVLNSFQESFILRLYREKKGDGLVKAFTDIPTAFNSLGQLQRTVDRLYVKKVYSLPRFHELVRKELDTQRITEWDVALPLALRRAQSTFRDVIRTCLRELKQSSLARSSQEEDELTNGTFAFSITSLEKQLAEKRSYLSDKQKRLLSDLECLRNLLRTAEDMDPASLLFQLNAIRNDKERVENSGGWLLTPTAAKVVADVESLCKNNKFVAPPKWKVLGDILEEIKEMPINEKELGEEGPSILVFVSDEQTCRQVSDIVKYGPKFVEWLARRQIFNNGKEPDKEPFWDPESISVYMRAKANAEERNQLISNLQKTQKDVARKAQKRRLIAESMTSSTGHQLKISQFGILHYKKRKSEIRDNESEPAPGTSSSEVKDEIEEVQIDEEPVMKRMKDFEKVPLVISPLGERYNTLQFLEKRQPNVIIMYNSDVATIRMIEIYKACYPHIHLIVHKVQYNDSTEEERYLTWIGNEIQAFHNIVKENANLLIPRVWDVDREEPLTLSVSSRDGGGRVDEPKGRPSVVVDMREFNSELPTVLYKKGFDVNAVTLEVGDYVLTPGIAVERKALDDLTQSLQSGRVFKQTEQMLRHYANSFLLVESNRKFESKIVNGGPFQGELSRHCRDVRLLLCSLIRQFPKLKLIWSVDPKSSADYFAELKVGHAEPDVERAIAIRSDEVPEEEAAQGTSKKTKVNPHLLRHMSSSLPGMTKGDVQKMMVSGKIKSLKHLLSSSASSLESHINPIAADKIALLANFDFSSNN